MSRYSILPAHVPRGGNNSRVIEETAGGEVARVSLELLAHPHVPLPRLETVDGADVVKSSARHETARRSVGTSHNPARSQGNGVDLGREREGGRESGREREGGREGGRERGGGGGGGGDFSVKTCSKSKGI